ncbi:MAG TPA: hypothetical protein VFD30_13290 [Terriglobia bacterium]|jgi:hypothetical protein|nr:hypothetical protein [Terriglobia bacterium]
MADDELRMDIPEDGQSATPEERTVQTTLSAIGDLGVASSDLSARRNRPQVSQGVLAGVIFFWFVYILSIAVTGMTSASSPAVRLLLTPLAPTACATVAFLSSRIWKRRALEFKSGLTVSQKALERLGYEAANAANATQVNLTGFFETHPELKQEEHLEEIEAAVRKIDSAVQAASERLKKKPERASDGSSAGLPGSARSNPGL